MGTEEKPQLTTVVTLAPFVPMLPSSGHTYWFHRSLTAGFKRSGFQHLTIGPASSSNEFVSGVLRLNPVKRIRWAYFPLLGLMRDTRSISKRLSEIEGKVILHVYEGGLREFLTIAWLLKNNPRTKAYFNFCLVDPWLPFLSGRLPLRNRVRAFQRIYGAIESRVVFTAESLELFDRLGLSGARMEYPLFSDLPRPSILTNRFCDVIFAPMGDAELSACLESVRLFNASHSKQLIFMVHMRWGTTVSEALRKEINQLGGELKNDRIAPEAYLKLYESSKIAVLPYQTYSHYQYQSSGRLLDALALGCKVVVPKDTVLARIISDLASGCVVDPESSEAISAAITELLSQQEMTLHEGVFDAQTTALEIVRAVDAKQPGSDGTAADVGVGDTLVSGLGLLLATPRSFITGFLSALGLPMAPIGKLISKFSSSKNRL